MLNTEKEIEIKWNYANRKWFINKGYTFTNWGDSFYANPLDLNIGSPIKVYVICDYCGEEYQTQYNVYNDGIKKLNKCACSKCAAKKSQEISKQKRIDKMYQKLLDAADRKGYKLLSKKEDYIDQSTYIHYQCPIHGEKEMLSNNFLRRNCCPDCGNISRKITKRLSVGEVKKRINSINGNILLNPEEYKGNDIMNLKVRCSCGNIFYTSIAKYNKKFRCSECAKSESNGESLIRQYLENNKIDYIPQYKFEDCRDKNKLPFDFYLPSYNLCIEFDGEQHKRPRKGWSDFEYVQKHDKIKTNYCIDNYIDLLRIDYNQQDNIEKILNDKLKIT